MPVSKQAVKKVTYSYPLGYLATDHVGYASFDLGKFPENNIFSADDNGKREYSVFVYPMGKEGSRLDVLEQARLTKEAIFAKLEIDRPVFDVDLKALNLPSMQKPSLVDWYFSPGSFAAKPEFLVGQDGCEKLMPSQLALQQFNFRYVVRVGKPPEGLTIPADCKFGYVDEYRASWYSLGHSLGEISYSLPLAPGESVKLAVIDWSWDSLTKRGEKTTLTEQVLHETHRDRTITETVKATLNEWQRGGSFMAGLARSQGESSSKENSSSASGTAFSLGGGYSTTSGRRDLAAENVQRLIDGFKQASSAQREINSTVVIQARQEEKESIQTRTFTNYNHSHTLTILYYEVLRHFKVEVEWVRRTSAILVSDIQADFDDRALQIYRPILEVNLLDSRLSLGFIALEKLRSMQIDDVVNPKTKPPEPLHPRKYIFTTFLFKFEVDEEEASDPVFIWARLSDGTTIPLKYRNSTDINFSDELFNNDGIYEIVLIPEPVIEWERLIGFDISLGGDDNLQLNQVGFRGAGKFGSIIELRKFEGPYLRFIDKDKTLTITTNFPGADLPIPPALSTPVQRLSIEENAAVELLRNHVNQFKSYYHRLIALNRDPNAIASVFESKTWDANNKFIDRVEPFPLEVFGSYVAYPLIEEEGKVIKQPIKEMKEAKAENLITLPTRGVFAEGKLGHCNISEEIDNTRFWKWEEHPIPFEAPGINPVTPVTPQPQQTNIAPTPFPSSIVNIVNPSAAPDPTGLGDALKLLSTPNIFRDMSGRAEVADLLKKLSDNTIGIAEAANKAGEIRAKYGGDLAGNTGGSGSKPGGSSGSSGSTGSPSSSGSSGGNSSGADELNKRVDAVKGMTGYVDPQEIKETMAELNKFARKRSLFDDGAIASTDGGAISANNAEFVSFYKEYLDNQYPNNLKKQGQIEDSSYTRNRDFYTLKSYEKTFGQKISSWNPELGFKLNERNIRSVYDYYQTTYKAKSDKFLWAGLGRLAGGAVLGGLLNPALPDPSFLSCTMVLIGKAIFLDLAWQHELFLADPQKMIAMAHEHDIRYPSKVSYEAAWKKIASNDQTQVNEGNRMLLENEQFTIIQPLYEKIIQSADSYLFSKTSAFTGNIHPYHLQFLKSFPTTQNVNIAVANDRWNWIVMPGGMWEKWLVMPSAERNRLINLSIDDLINQRWSPIITTLLPPGGQ